MSAARIELKHILVPTDFDEPANHALDLALSLAEKLDGEVTLLHVQHIPQANYDLEALWPSEEAAASAQRAIDAAVAQAKKRYARCHGALRRDFAQTSDQEVERLLALHWRQRESSRTRLP